MVSTFPASAASIGAFLFFALPRELRDQIYAYCDFEVGLKQAYFYASYVKAAMTNAVTPPTLRLVSRQFKQELEAERRRVSPVSALRLELELKRYQEDVLVVRKQLRSSLNLIAVLHLTVNYMAAPGRYQLTEVCRFVSSLKTLRTVNLIFTRVALRPKERAQAFDLLGAARSLLTRRLQDWPVPYELKVAGVVRCRRNELQIDHPMFDGTLHCPKHERKHILLQATLPNATTFEDLQQGRTSLSWKSLSTAKPCRAPTAMQAVKVKRKLPPDSSAASQAGLPAQATTNNMDHLQVPSQSDPTPDDASGPPNKRRKLAVSGK